MQIGGSGARTAVEHERERPLRAVGDAPAWLKRIGDVEDLGGNLARAAQERQRAGLRPIVECSPLDRDRMIRGLR